MTQLGGDRIISKPRLGNSKLWVGTGGGKGGDRLKQAIPKAMAREGQVRSKRERAQELRPSKIVAGF